MGQICSLTRLVSLNLSLCSSISATQLASNLPQLSILKVLHLSGLRTIDSETFTDLIQNMKMLESFNIVNCENVRELLALPSPNQMLRVLDISWNRIELTRFNQLMALEVLKAEGKREREK